MNFCFGRTSYSDPPDEKNSLAKPTALHRGSEIEQMEKCFLDITA